MLGSEEAEGHTDFSFRDREVSFCFHQRGRALEYVS